MTRFPAISAWPLLGWLVASSLLVPTAWAAAAAPNPLDAGAAVPAVEYTSALARYKPLADEPALSWREANERVGRIGGWRVYAREAAQAEATATPAAASPGGKATVDAKKPASGSNPAFASPAGSARTGSTSTEAPR